MRYSFLKAKVYKRTLRFRGFSFKLKTFYFSFLANFCKFNQKAAKKRKNQY